MIDFYMTVIIIFFVVFLLVLNQIRVVLCDIVEAIYDLIEK